ncbi:hypothetical protein COL97_15685 [Bacillus safensis]|nr:hypothetical protein COL97_15685 [Bacillus safensis]
MKTSPKAKSQRVDKPSHSPAGLCASAHECQIRSAPVLVLPRLQRFSITLKRRQRAKINIILALCQQSETSPKGEVFFLQYCGKTHLFKDFS